MSRIDGLLASIITEAWGRGNHSYVDYDYTYGQQAAITAPWDMALKALKDAESQLLAIDSVCDEAYQGTSDELDSFLDSVIPEINLVKIRAAIAAMEGETE